MLGIGFSVIGFLSRYLARNWYGYRRLIRIFSNSEKFLFTLMRLIQQVPYIASPISSNFFIIGAAIATPSLIAQSDLLTAHLVIIRHTTAPCLPPLPGFLVPSYRIFKVLISKNLCSYNFDLREAHDG